MNLGSINEIQKDIDELKELLTQVKRNANRDLIESHILRTSAQIDALKSLNNEITTKQSDTIRFNDVKISTYAWDQDSKFVKFYLTIPNAENLNSDNCKLEGSDRSITFDVFVDKYRYRFTLVKLLDDIDVDKSSWKVKKDRVILNLCKVNAVHWSHVTETEKRAEEARMPNLSKKEDMGDPNESLMNMMKQMYESGDDDLKRTIAKAWTESQEKKGAFK